MRYVYKVIIILSIFGLILPNFSIISGQISPDVKLPGNWEEIKDAGLRALRLIPDSLKGIWEGLKDFLQNVWSWFKNVWNSYIFPFLENLWEKTLGKEIRERKPAIEEEFQKETEEVREEIKAGLPETLKSLWERFKELLK